MFAGAAAGGVGCGSCGSSDRIAELVALSGTVEREDAPSPDTNWQGTSTGDGFVIGEAVRTKAQSSARLTFTSGGALRMQPSTAIRFRSRGQRGGWRVAMDMGEAELEAGAGGLQLETLLGIATVEPGTTVRVNRDRNMRIEVVVGSATIEGNGGRERIEQGQGIVVDVGGAVIERTGTAADAGTDAGPPRVAPVDAGIEAGVDAGLVAGTYAIDVRGRASRARSTGESRWRTLTLGAGEVGAGTRLSVPSGGSVEVRGVEGTATVQGAAEIVVGQGGALVDASTGRVAVNATSGDVRVVVPGGSIVARGSDGVATADLAIGRDHSTRVEVRAGTVDIRSDSGTSHLGAGETGTLRAGGEVEGTEQIAEAPSRADVSLGLGEPGTIHDVGAPTAVRIRFGSSCPSDGVVELARGRTFTRPLAYRGTGGAAIIVAPAGSTRYRLRCVEGGNTSSDVAGTGTVRVARDSGVQPLPRGAPRTTVDADGRRYTVLYQNLLPELTFRWPRAPGAGGYVLRVEGGRQPVEQRSSGSSVSFPTGRFDEGTYRFTFATADGATRSAPTTLTIDFDNAAPAAYVRQPAPGAPVSGTVHVEGIALEGANVSVDGHALNMDAQHRFSGDVAGPTDEACLAIRIAHPQRGVHYYLRCGGGG